MEGRKNVILLTIDSLRADHLSCLGYSKKVSPNIDNLAKKGVLFSQAISNSNTPSSFPSIITSFYPRFHFSGDTRVLPDNWLFLSDERVSIAEVLKSEGYLTAAFHSNPWISSFFHYDKGFDTFDDQLDIRKAKFNIHVKHNLNLGAKVFNMLRGKTESYRANVINNKAVYWLKNNPRGFFIWIHYMDVHTPYIPLECSFLERINALRLYRKVEKKQNLSDDELKKYIEFYDGEIRYVDHEIGSFLNEIGKMDISLDNTYIILTSDHGDQLMEHGGFGHGFLYDEVIRVPLIISGPGLKENILIGDQIHLLDLSPTIADLLNIPKVESFQGKSVLPLINGKKKREKGVISEGINEKQFSFRTKEWKYILIVDENNEQISAELYNLLNDPEERNNLIKKERERSEEFKSKLFEHISIEEKKCLKTKNENNFTQRGSASEYNNEKKEEIEKRLRSLGYM